MLASRQAVRALAVGAMPLRSAALVRAMFREIEAALRRHPKAPTKGKRPWLYDESGVDESSYHRYKRSAVSPQLEDMYNLYAAVGLTLRLRGTTHTVGGAGEAGGRVLAPKLAEAIAVLEGMSDLDKEQVVGLIHRYAAARGIVVQGPLPDGEGSAAARRK